MHNEELIESGDRKYNGSCSYAGVRYNQKEF